MQHPTCDTAAVIATRPPRIFAGRIADGAAHVPLLRQVLVAAYAHWFDQARGNVRLFRGVFADFAAARCAIPVHACEGCDNELSVLRVAHERRRVLPLDYPVMFWLSRLLPRCHLLFDWGGSVGISYFAFRRYLDYPCGLTWLVQDLPAAVRLGRELAETEAAPGLRFTDSLAELADADLLLAAGSLHFIEAPFAELRRLPHLPRHILLNKVPVYTLPAAVTLQNMGTAFCPNHLFNHDEFLQQFARLGYTMVDEWTTPELSCRIPFEPQRSIAAYSGFYLEKAA